MKVSQIENRLFTGKRGSGARSKFQTILKNPLTYSPDPIDKNTETKINSIRMNEQLKKSFQDTRTIKSRIEQQVMTAKTNANVFSKSPEYICSKASTSVGFAPSFNRFNGKNTYKQFEIVNQSERYDKIPKFQLEQVKDHPEYLSSVTGLTVKSAQVKNCSIATYMAKNIDKNIQSSSGLISHDHRIPVKSCYPNFMQTKSSEPQIG